MADPRKPTLVVVNGFSGTGKTSLAHALARAMPCPAICRDELKEGLVHTEQPEQLGFGDDTTLRASHAFFDTIELLVGASITIVVEAAFQQHMWEPRLTPLLDRADIRLVRCVVDQRVARDRVAERADSRPSHLDRSFVEAVDSGEFAMEKFNYVQLDVPLLIVDTTDGYVPPFDEIVAFVRD